MKKNEQVVTEEAKELNEYEIASRDKKIKIMMTFNNIIFTIPLLLAYAGGLVDPIVSHYIMIGIFITIPFVLLGFMSSKGIPANIQLRIQAIPKFVYIIFIAVILVINF